MKNLSFFFITVLLLILTGCGGSGFSQEDETTKVITGKVIDGEIKDSVVFLDLNQDGELSENEPNTKSSSDGSFSLTFTESVLNNSLYKNGHMVIIANGGYDMRAQRSFSGKLKFNIDINSLNINITPITTLIAEMLKNRVNSSDSFNTVSSTKSEIKTKIAKFYSILTSDLEANPIDYALKANSKLLQITLSLQKSIENLSLAINNNSEEAYIALAKSFNASSDMETYSSIVENSFSFGLNSSLKEKITSNINSLIIKIESEFLKYTTFNDLLLIELSKSIDTISLETKTQTDTTTKTETNTGTEGEIDTTTKTDTKTDTEAETNTTTEINAATSTTSSSGGTSLSSETNTTTKTDTETNTTTEINAATSTTSSSGGTSLSSETISISGKAVDGPLVGSVVFLDLNRNGKFDSGEPKTETDKNGNYELNLPSSIKENADYKSGYAPIVVVDGIDSSRGKKFRGRLKAPINLRKPPKKAHINPITTVVAESIEVGENITENLNDTEVENIFTKTKVKVAAQLDLEVTTIDEDIEELAQKGDKKSLQVALQIHKSVEISKEIIDFEKVKEEDAITSIYKSFAFTLNQKSSTIVDLGSVFEETINDDEKSIFRTSISTSLTVISNIKTMITKTKELSIFKTTTTFTSSTFVELSMKFDKIESLLNEGNNTFGIDEIETFDFKTAYNKNILSEHVNTVGFTDKQINSFFNGLIASIEDIIKIEANFTSYYEEVKTIVTATGLTEDEIEDKIYQSDEEGIVKKIDRYSDWTKGFCERVYIENRSSDTVIWEFKDFNVSGILYDSWNVLIDEQTKKVDNEKNITTFTASGMSWNKELEPLKEISFGYCAYKTSNVKPVDANESSGKITITKTDISKWGNGECKKVKIQNTSNDPVNWKIENLDILGDVYYTSYGITYESSSGKITTIQDKDSNDILIPKQSFYFDYCSSEDKDNAFIITPYKTYKTWSGSNPGSCKSIKVRNTTGSAKMWSIEDLQITGFVFHSWDSNLISSLENKISVKGVTANKYIENNREIYFGYCSTNRQLSISSTNTTPSLVSKKENGLCTDITLVNGNSEAIKWKYDIESANSISYSSDTTLSKNGNRYTFSGNYWNEILAPNETILFRYCHKATFITEVALGDRAAEVDQHGYFGHILKDVVVASSFDKITDENLSNFYDITLKAVNSSAVSDGTKDINIAFLVNRFNKELRDIDIQLLVIVPITVTKNGNDVKIISKANSEVTLIGRKSDGKIITSTITNKEEDVKQVTTGSGEVTFTLKAGGILNRFTSISNHPDVGDYIKNIIFTNITNPNSYDVVVAFTNNIFENNTPIVLKDLGYDIDLPKLMRVDANSDIGKKITNLMGLGYLRGYVGMVDIQ